MCHQILVNLLHFSKAEGLLNGGLQFIIVTQSLKTTNVQGIKTMVIFIIEYAVNHSLFDKICHDFY